MCFFRIRMLNSTQYRKHAIKSNYPYWLVIRRYWKPMAGTGKLCFLISCIPQGSTLTIAAALAWFCYDFVTYPFSLFSSTIVQQFNPQNTAIQNIGFGVSLDPDERERELTLFVFITNWTLIDCHQLLPASRLRSWWLFDGSHWP